MLRGGGLLLASKKNIDSLLANCKRFNLKAKDGFLYFSAKINKHFSDKFKGKRICAVVLKNYDLEQKHLGNILSILESNGFIIFYLLSFENFLQEQLSKILQENNKEFLYVGWDMISYLDFFPFVIDQTMVYRFSQKVANLRMIPSFDMYPNTITHPDSMRNYDLHLEAATYVNCHCQSLYDLTYKNQQWISQVALPNGEVEEFASIPNPSYKLIKGGYPSIDKVLKEYSPKNVKRELVIFIGEHINFITPKELGSLMGKILENGFKVLYKTSRQNAQSEKDMCVDFFNNSNFEYYEKLRLNDDILDRSICIVGAVSSMLYTFPITTKRPGILYYSLETVSSYENKFDSFYNSDLHLCFCKGQEDLIIDAIYRLKNDLEYQNKWHKKIDSFIKNNLFNAGKASEFLANWIIDWYEKRELIENI